MAIKVTALTGDDGMYQYRMTFAQAKAVLVSIAEEEDESSTFDVTVKKSKDVKKGHYLLWKSKKTNLAYPTPLGKSCDLDTDPADLEYGYNEGMESFIGYVRSTERNERTGMTVTI
jgi:hypothetical protein